MRFLLALVAGAVGGALVWRVAAKRLDRQLTVGLDQLSGELTAGGQTLQRRLEAGRAELRSVLDAELARTVPPMVRAEIVTTLHRYNITPQMGRQVAVLLAAASRAGLLPQV